jgi:hypothetical protein
LVILSNRVIATPAAVNGLLRGREIGAVRRHHAGRPDAAGADDHTASAEHCRTAVSADEEDDTSRPPLLTVVVPAGPQDDAKSPPLLAIDQRPARGAA